MEKSKVMTETEPLARTVFFLGDAAVGKRNPNAEKINTERFNEFVEALTSNRFYSRTALDIPTDCADDRSSIIKPDNLAPNAAGGTASLLVADALTTKRFRHGEAPATEHLQTVCDYLLESSLPIGAHNHDTECNEVNSGCGACDKMKQILSLIGGNNLDKPKNSSIQIREIAKKLGIEVSDSVHDEIIRNASLLLTQNYVNDGAKVIEAIKEKAGENSISTRTGEHNIRALVINTEQNTTLDRDALEAEFGDVGKVLNVDAWSFYTAAGHLSISEEEYNKKVAALAYYNIATALVLCGPEVPVIVR